MKSYDHKKIEKKWQKEWAKKKIYRSKEKGKKTYILDMFPYPSGEGLHVGHPKGYIATDIFSRHARMNGKSVLHPMGWDAFGLPAENYAIKNKVHPRVAVEKNVKRFKEQLKLIGLDYDWNREINTTDPEFYKWTQWIFLKLFDMGLAYQSFEPINWCPSCQTGLANEDLEGNACERCGTIVEKRPMRQWVLKITDYAERLLQDLELLPEWQTHIKESQRNWIGKSEGAMIRFRVPGSGDQEIEVFTTRPDTLFGATYMVLSPEYSGMKELLERATNKDEVHEYIVKAGKKTEIERQENKEKTGVKLEGVEAINPATGEKVPLYVADYVLAHYGTGAIMAVPAHDERDWEFAKKFNIAVKQVVSHVVHNTEGAYAVRPREPFKYRDAVMCIVKHWEKNEYLCQEWTDYSGIRTLISGGIEDGEDVVATGKREIEEESGYTNAKFVRHIGGFSFIEFYHQRKETNMRARFRYLYYELENGEQKPIPEAEAAQHVNVWKKPDEVVDFLTISEKERVWEVFNGKEEIFTGNGYLVNSSKYDGLTTEEAKEKIIEKFGTKKTTYKIRDWVFSRQRYWGEPIPIIHCPKCGVVPVPEKDLPVKLPDVKKYEPTGTGESPLAAITKWVNVKCPKCKGKAKRETNTMPQWAGSSWYYLRYMDPKNKKAPVDKKKEKYWAPVDLYVGGAEHATRHLIYARFWHKFLQDIGAVSTPEPFTRLISVGLIQAEDGRKMSKRFGNVINPDDIIATYGADTLRVYEMFMGPFSDAIAWNTSSLIGARRFIERAWRLQEKIVAKTDEAVERELHKTIKKIGEDIGNFKFNTAISQMMIFVNLAEEKGITKKQYQAFIAILAPFAPHVSEELWKEFGGKGFVHVSMWPKFDAKKLVANTMNIVVQINGKVRAQVLFDANADEATIRIETEKAAEKWLQGKEIRKFIYVKGRLANFVIDK